MKKYFLVISNCLQDYFAYRLNFVLWRVRMIVSILITYFLWNAVYGSTSQIFGYRYNEMLTYILLTIFINGFVFSTQTFRIGEEINMGILSNFLVKPLSYFKYNLARDISDKIVNTFFSVFEFMLLIFLLKPPVFIQNNPYWIMMFAVSLVIAAVLYFEISFLLSMIGFWSGDTWAPRFLFSILVSFMSGMYFPLDILPQVFQGIVRYSPFTYLLFFPLKIYLGNPGNNFAFYGIIISLLWMIFLFILMKFVWFKGLKAYTAEGR